MKRKLLSAALLAVSALGFHANAQTDVTSSYIGVLDRVIKNGNHRLSDAGNDQGEGYFNTQTVTGQHNFQPQSSESAINTCIESWSPDNATRTEGYMLARLTVLPQGKYTLKFKARANNIDNMVVKFNDQEESFDTQNGVKEFTFDFDVATANTSYIFGVYQKEASSGVSCWAMMGDISLTLNSENIYPVPNNSTESFTYVGNQTWHTNTWSTEGNRDNTNFITPFHELWTAKDNNGKLTDATITGSYTPTETGVYKVSAWVRAYNENGGAVTGAKIFVADAETDACTGTPIPNGRLGTYTAMADGVTGTPFNYGFVIENAEINWLAFKNVTITYLGDLPEEEITALMEQIPSGKMNATVKATLDEYVNALNSNKSVANFNNLSLYLPTAKASADVYVTIDEAIKSYADKVAALSPEAQNAYDASNVQTKYDNGTYETLEEAEKDLAAALAIAIKSQKTVGSDWTGLIINPSFETGSLTGWESTGMSVQSNTSFANKKGSYYAESYRPNGTKSISQTIENMPTGIYRLSAFVKANEVASAKIYVNDVEQAITIADKEDIYNVDFACSEGDDITLGFTGVGTGSGWMAMDNFTLTFLGTEYPAIEAVEGKMNKEVAAKQSEALGTYNSEKNVTTYNTASNAVAAAKGSIAAYSKMKGELDRVYNEVSTTNVYTADAYKANYTDNLAAWADETISTEDANAYTFGSRTTGAGAAILLSPWAIGETTAVEDGSLYINTWSIEGDKDGSNFKTPFFEYYTDANKNLETKTFTATVPVENGFYKVSIWARAQSRSDAAMGEWSKTALTINVNGGESISLVNLDNKVGEFYIGTFEAEGEVTDGNLVVTINVVNPSNCHWLSFRDLNYSKIEEVSVEMSEIGYATFSSEYALDLSAIDGGTAYIVTDDAVEGNYIKLTEQTEAVPANTGLIIAGEGTVTIPVVATANPLDNKNYLVAGTGEEAPVGSYVLSCKYEEGSSTDLDLTTVGFYVVDKEQPIVEKGKAYLDFQGITIQTKALYFVFGDGTATAIGTAEAADADAEGVIYNVAGQQVGKDYKGIVIKNGKKYLNK